MRRSRLAPRDSIRGHVLLFGLLAAGCTEDRAPASRLRSHFSSEVCDLGEGAERVEVSRFHTDEFSRSLYPEGETVGEPVMASRPWVGRLWAVLGGNRSYEEGIPPCVPHPGVRVVFTRGAERADLFLCFECNILSIAKPGESRWKCFHSVRGELVDLVQEVFPRDPVIRALKR